MAIIANNLEGLSVAAVARKPLPPVPPEAVVAHLGKDTAGMRSLDDVALKVMVYTLPKPGIQIIIEPTRIRIDAQVAKRPEDMRLGERLGLLMQALYPSVAVARYGFNYDIAHQYDAVIPQREIIRAYLKEEAIEDITHFGWQCTRTRDKGARRDTHFFKVVSPLELRVLTNVELDKPLPDPAALQAEFERCYAESRAITDQLAFT